MRSQALGNGAWLLRNGARWFGHVAIERDRPRRRVQMLWVPLIELRDKSHVPLRTGLDRNGAGWLEVLCNSCQDARRLGAHNALDGGYRIAGRGSETVQPGGE